MAAAAASNGSFVFSSPPPINVHSLYVPIAPIPFWALPNSIVAMGTFNGSTLVVGGGGETKEPLHAAAAGMEKRLHEAYSNYQQLSQRKTVVGGLPAVEFKYRGKADDHDWTGKLVVVGRGKDMFTVLAMTYADSDLIQIQENVIARSIASLDFSAHYPGL